MLDKQSSTKKIYILPYCVINTLKGPDNGLSEVIMSRD